MENQPGYYAVIPAIVRYSKELEPNAKLLYGEITALCNQEGYCWATNRYFADLYDVDIRTVQRWISSLEKNNFIICEVNRSKFKTERKIVLNNSFQNISTARHKCQEDQTKPAGGGAKNATQNNTCNNTHKKQQQEPVGVVVFYECLREIGLSEKEQKSLMKYPEKEVKNAVTFATHPKTSIKTTLIKTIMWALKEKPKVPQPIDEKENKKLATFSENNFSSKSWNLEALNSKVTVNSKIPTCSEYYEISYKEENFESKLKNLLSKCRFERVPK